VVVIRGSTRKQRYSSVPPPVGAGVYGVAIFSCRNRSPPRNGEAGGSLTAA